MSITLLAATTAISLALVLYTFGVFDERRRGTLTKKNVALFWAGFLFDTTGTTIMTSMAISGGTSALGMHALSGVFAIALMAIHATWATVTFVRKNDKAMAKFHTFSIVVWLFWLMPYTLGVLQGVPMLHLANLQAGIVALIVVVILGLAVFLSGHKARIQEARNHEIH
ncbi:MAG: HsmA family protein [Raoultibacter sp.]